MDPECIAIDMFAQAEHYEMAQSILLTTSAKLILDVNKKFNIMIKIYSDLASDTFCK